MLSVQARLRRRLQQRTHLEPSRHAGRLLLPHGELLSSSHSHNSRLTFLLPAGHCCLLVRFLGARFPFCSLTSRSHSFLGFVFALNHLCDGAYSISRISEWLIFIWFGLDGTGLEKSPKFHPLLGPGLITVYAALSNTLLVSLLVSILSTTYSQIAADAVSRLSELSGSALTFLPRRPPRTCSARQC